MENNQDVLLKVEHLKKYYSIKSSSLRGKKSVVKAVDDISFDVKIGETFGIVGESGCGKSTMGKSVIRLIEPTEGKVILDGQDFTSLKGKELQEARDKIKLIFQDPYASLNPRMTVKDIIAEPIDIAKCYKTQEERDARVVEVMKQVGLNLDYMYRYPHEFSGGQRQRIGIARAIALQPKLIICDEPVSALDVSIQAKIINLLNELQEKMGIALQKLAEEDPTFRVETNPETGETVISGMGELHLDVLVDRLKREHKVEANVGAPQVSYRETFRASTQARGFFKRQSGGKGQFGDVWIEFTPNEEGKGFEFENAIVGGVVPREFIPAVEKGLEESMANGVLAGYPMVDIKAKLYDGSYHDVDSSETAFKIAASLALKEAAKTAQPTILEPMMLVTITVPEENLGDVMGHVTARRGRVDGMEAHGNSQIVRAYVPLAEMFGYATTLRSATQGRGTFMMVFDHYEDVPKSVQEEIIKKNSGEA